MTEIISLAEKIKTFQKPLIIFHKDTHGDLIGSALSLYHFLQKLGQHPQIFSAEFKTPKYLEFLEDVKLIQSDKKQLLVSTDCSDISPIFDSLIVLGDFQIELADEFSSFFQKIPRLVIDKTNFFADKAFAEIIYELFQIINDKLIDEKIATYLLTGMVEKNKGFKIDTLTPESLLTTSDLLTKGANRETVITNLFGRQSVSTIKLWGKILLNLEIIEDYEIAIAKVNEQDLIDAHADENDLCQLIDELISSVETVKSTAIFFSKNKKPYCLIKSEKKQNLTKHFADFAELYAYQEKIIFSYSENQEKIIEKLKSL